MLNAAKMALMLATLASLFARKIAKPTARTTRTANMCDLKCERESANGNHAFIILLRNAAIKSKAARLNPTKEIRLIIELKLSIEQGIRFENEDGLVDFIALRHELLSPAKQ